MDGAASKGQFRIVLLINKTDFLLRDGESQTWWERECCQIWKEFIFEGLVCHCVSKDS